MPIQRKRGELFPGLYFYEGLLYTGLPLDAAKLLQSCPTLQPHGLQQARLLCPSLSPGVCYNSCPSSWWCHSTVSSSVIPFSCLQSFSASGSFPMSQFFASGGQSIRTSVSASVLPMNIQDWFPLELTGWISLLSKGLSRDSPAAQMKVISSLACSLFYCPALTSVHDYWKNHSFDKTRFCRQSNVSAF